MTPADCEAACTAILIGFRQCHEALVNEGDLDDIAAQVGALDGAIAALPSPQPNLQTMPHATFQDFPADIAKRCADLLRLADSERNACLLDLEHQRNQSVTDAAAAERSGKASKAYQAQRQDPARFVDRQQ